MWAAGAQPHRTRWGPGPAARAGSPAAASLPRSRACIPAGLKPDRGLGVRDAELFGAADTEPTVSAGRNINTRRLHELHGS